ncbi:MAG: DUF4445 domain-containing protein [Clostridiales bacterium]|nr:DUF4445 domain-containing protein [Clostridiales bacterium]
MITVSIRNDETKIGVDKGSNLMDALIQSDYPLENPCNGTGTCGKCKVKIINSEQYKISSSDMKHLSEEELSLGYRLSCMISLEEDIEIELVQVNANHKILTYGHVPPFEFDPKVKPVGSNRYGICVDIGTTTVVASLVDMASGNEVDTASKVNPQKKYGLDVLTRITYCAQNDLGIKDLQMEIVNCLNELIQSMVQNADINASQIIDIVISANTTMLHFLLGIDASSIGHAPYKPVFTDAQTVDCTDIGINLPKGVSIYCLPSVSSYIGADIVSGCYVSDLYKSLSTKLLIDVGTNGEIVLAHEGKLYACSCAAGPALEGMNISSGVRAQDGAIEELSLNKECVTFKTIGNHKVIGVCGSGILAILRELLHHGLVNNRGTIIKPKELSEDDYRRGYIKENGKKRFILLENKEDSLKVTQNDIRQIQLAKGAILSGLQALTQRAGVSFDSIDEVIIAGQFGTHLSSDSLVGTGIVPDELFGKIRYLGNTSKSGAYMVLMSKLARQEIEVLSNRIHYFELADTPDYERIFAKALLF